MPVLSQDVINMSSQLSWLVPVPSQPNCQLASPSSPALGLSCRSGSCTAQTGASRRALRASLRACQPATSSCLWCRVQAPASVALPFGTFERVLAADCNRSVAAAVADAEKQAVSRRAGCCLLMVTASLPSLLSFLKIVYLLSLSGTPIPHSLPSTVACFTSTNHSQLPSSSRLGEAAPPLHASPATLPSNPLLNPSPAQAAEASGTKVPGALAKLRHLIASDLAAPSGLADAAGKAAAAAGLIPSAAEWAEGSEGWKAAWGAICQVGAAGGDACEASGLPCVCLYVSPCKGARLLLLLLAPLLLYVCQF